MRIRKMLDPDILPTAWASSYSRKSRLSARPLLGAAIAVLLVPSPLTEPAHARQVATSAVLAALAVVPDYS